MNILSIYRKEYLNKRVSGAAADPAHAFALESVYMSMLHHSAASNKPVQHRDMVQLKDIQSNPFYRQLLEEIVNMSIEERKAYLANIAKVPQLKLVK